MCDRISKRINVLSTKLKRYIYNLELQSYDQCTEENMFILVYIYRNSDKDIYQKDIEREFGITRSTASNCISLMEKKQLIERVQVKEDARLKKLVLTNAAKEHAVEFIESMKQFDKKLLDGFSKEEQQNLISYLERISNNIEKKE